MLILINAILLVMVWMMAAQNWLEVFANEGVAENMLVGMDENGAGLQQGSQLDQVGGAASVKNEMCKNKTGHGCNTSMAIATAAALHFAVYSSVLGVPRYSPIPWMSATPVYNPCRRQYHYDVTQTKWTIPGGHDVCKLLRTGSRTYQQCVVAQLSGCRTE